MSISTGFYLAGDSIADAPMAFKGQATLPAP